MTGTPSAKASTGREEEEKIMFMFQRSQDNKHLKALIIRILVRT